MPNWSIPGSIPGRAAWKAHVNSEKVEAAQGDVKSICLPSDVVIRSGTKMGERGDTIW